MKVVFVTRGWPSKDNPLPGNYEAVQAKALAKRGVDVTVINCLRKSCLHFFDSRSITKKVDEGVTVLSIVTPLIAIPRHLEMHQYKVNLYIRQRAFLKVYEYYRKENGDADVIHAHIINWAYDCKKVIDKYHIPFVITEHWSKMNYATLDAGLAKLAEGYQWADRVVCVSSALADSLKQKFGLECRVINNMVSDSFFDQKAELKNTSLSCDMVKFVSVGTLVYRKGYDLIIRALRGTEYLDRLQLSIIGGGLEEGNLRALIEQCQLQDKVFLLGKKTPEEVSEQIAASDCFILASRRETFGIVYIEAMAKGKPVIATICGGPESFVNESNGVLIPADDVEAATKAIDYMVEHLNQYDSAVIREYCYDNFSEERIAQKIIALYNEVLEERKKHN